MAPATAPPAIATAATENGETAPGEAAPGEAAPEISTSRRLGAVGASLVPGVLVHGAGSWVLGERRTAKRLAIAGWIGFAAIAVGGAAVGITGGAPEMTIWGVPVIIAGAGLAIPTWVEDIWRSAGGGRGGLRGEAHARSPWWIEVGTTWLHDAYRERGLARGAARVEIGRVALATAGLLDVEGRARTGEVGVGFRLWGAPATGDVVGDGSRLEVRTAVRRHADDDDRIAITTVEAEVAMRADLLRLDPGLAGSFVELSLGMGGERVRYADTVSDADSLFLGRFGWGLYLGRHSEAVVFYDHRRDSLAGGIAAGRAAGFVGCVGAQVDLRLGGPFALAGGVEIGSGWVTTVGLRYHGDRP